MDRRQFLTSAAATPLLSSAAASAQSPGIVAAQPVSPAHSFPPEWGPHECIWMGWSEWGGLQTLQLEMIAALSTHVPVRVLVRDEAMQEDVIREMIDFGIAPNAMATRIGFHQQLTLDVWVRDCGPLFVSDGQSLEIATFAWNNYGYPWPYTNPDTMARGELDTQLGAAMGWPQRASHLVTEGGALEVNSRTLITYRDAIMDRNPHLALSEIEAELKRLYGKQQVIFLDRAPITDRVLQGPKIANFFGWGANGHVDEYVRFVSENTILVGEVGEDERTRDPLMRLEHEILTENRRQLEAARDPDGRPFNVVPMPVPDAAPFAQRRALREGDFSASPEGSDQRLIYRDFAIGDEVIDMPAVSYLNFLVTNGVVLSAKYGGEGRPDLLARSDEQAAALLRQCFPDREIVLIDPLDANWNGGGMHCLTQQQPLIGT